ncbi:SGNH/GDSL hydrolase family protein [Flaviaesturariibacter flavus]|uniref:SGNH/GDSL hydrolase family protein n=1 Tax=Flaviaesturariibacter flavus TaxID=2502780 RepID=A0A4R1BPD8_9BACT|nr:SGNH/GDSL hydrolase family protein [Flaviaesturariibacter flavus]TCJ19187.1 SGNH/GDSL hydrolase family protein [Flaviaesturariibacter flavus]
MEKLYTYLALGDSYTIGEAVPLPASFPYQAVQALRREKVHLAPPEVIAKTGWTTDELTSALEGYTFLKSYDFVSLLIGVNNQYRGRTVEAYTPECAALLERAVALAHGKAQHVFVLSIPDYGVSPFAKEKGLDPEKIAAEVDQFNAAARALAAQYGTHYIDITEGSREAAFDPSLLAVDGLHPSEKEYVRWAAKLALAMRLEMNP